MKLLGASSTTGFSAATDTVRTTLAKRRGLLASGLVLATVQSLVMLPIPIVVRRAFDHAIPVKDRAELMALAFALVGLAVVSGAVAVFSQRLVQRATKSMTEALRSAVIQQIFDADLPKVDGLDPEAVHERLIGDPVHIEAAANAMFRQVLPATVLFGGLLVLLVTIDPVLTLVVAASAPILFAINRALRPSLQRSMEDTQRAFEALGRHSLTLVRAQLLLRGRGIDADALIRAKAEIATLKNESEGRSLRLATRGAIQASGLAAATAATLVAGGDAVISGRLSLGSLLSFFAAVALIRAPSGTLTSVGPVLLEGRLSLRRLDDHLALPLGSRTIETGHETFVRVNELALCDVSYRYDGTDRYAVENLSLRLRAGRVLALSGPNGVGKTTILTLLLGLVRPERGVVRVNGVDVAQVDAPAFRRQIGVLFQHSLFLPGTLRENLRSGRLDATDADLAQALDDAEATSIIGRLPQGLDTEVGEDLDQLSGGERQRLALARTLLCRPGLIIFDEPSNHVPSALVIRVVDRVRRWPEPPAVLLISHDPNLLALADDRLTVRGHDAKDQVA